MSTAAVVPVFDETGGSLARTLAGLARQTSPPEQVVVVDDASARPLAPVPDVDVDVDVIRLPQNGGLSQARNQGAASTESAYLLFVNCDVVLAPDWLERGLAYLEEHPHTGAVSGRIAPVAGPQVLRDWRLQHIEPKLHRSPPAGPTPVSWLVGHALLVRRDVFDEVGGFDPRFRTAGEDWNFSERVRASGGRLVHLPELVAESHEVASIDHLARKSVRNARWDLRTASKQPCSGIRPLRPVAATGSVLRTTAERSGRDILRGRLKLLPVDLAVGVRSIILVWQARHFLARPNGYSARVFRRADT
jgi:GT2 family glycosyltransferase